jgi:hypothetical protein
MIMNFNAYIKNEEAKPGKNPDELYRTASKKSLFVDDKIVASEKQILE